MEENRTFWGDLTKMILGTGQQYYLGQQQAQTNITLQQINAATITNIVKWLAIIIVVGGIIKAILSRRK